MTSTREDGTDPTDLVADLVDKFLSEAKSTHAVYEQLEALRRRLAPVEVVLDRGGLPIEVGRQVAMKLPGRPRSTVFGTVRSVSAHIVEIWDEDAGTSMFHSAAPNQVRVRPKDESAGRSIPGLDTCEQQ